MAVVTDPRLLIVLHGTILAVLIDGHVTDVVNTTSLSLLMNLWVSLKMNKLQLSQSTDV